MDNSSIYADIAARTGGNIYIGVVGPVRTGKSTFIKRFMETLVLPNISDDYVRERARDELPQSGSGRTIMTAEPKFVPEDAVSIELDASVRASVRLIDSVGYMIPGANGQYENGEERLVTTPWYDHEIPMRVAAEEGTRKVIREHSTIGIVVTTDGSVTERGRTMPRQKRASLQSCRTSASRFSSCSTRPIRRGRPHRHWRLNCASSTMPPACRSTVWS